MKNQKYIIRGDKSGVFYGEIKERNPNDASNVVFSNIRRIWYWDGAATCSQLALDGVAAPNNCKFTVTVAEIELTDVVELIPCTDEACASIDAVPVWKR